MTLERQTTDEYVPPTLVELGTLEDLTQSGGGFGSDFQGPANS